MDKFGSAKSAFSTAKGYAEKGRASITPMFDKMDKAVPIGSGGNRPRTGSSATSPGLAPPVGAPYSSSSSSPSSRPPPPPMRTGSAHGPPATPARNSTPSAAATGGVFTAMLTDEQEKLAFFQLLDEYFNSRPQFAGLFEGSPHAAAPAPAPAAARNHAPVAPAASRPVPAAPAGLGTATALYDFEGTQAEDLPFRTGDVISITEIVSDDWLKGSLHGRTGIFPTAYVQRS
ncbi:hypothetical protein BMF94_0838 [Rhodotorula taiwanensis]|uniref:SH3 domain-containing protein n=1 Tax=Rhodotorula taiwanensis TaxID=741276 RepID=A0A2S5BH82_9BASI|nr:hypothetical protein BMF94_0838 [Rhodotorula taiwanensis]